MCSSDKAFNPPQTPSPPIDEDDYDGLWDASLAIRPSTFIFNEFPKVFPSGFATLDISASLFLPRSSPALPKYWRRSGVSAATTKAGCSGGASVEREMLRACRGCFWTILQKEFEGSSAVVLVKSGKEFSPPGISPLE